MMKNNSRCFFIRPFFFGTLFLFMGSYCLLGAQRIWTPYQMLYTYYGCSNLYNGLVVQKRACSDFKSKKDQSPIIRIDLKPSIDINQGNELTIYKSFLEKFEGLLSETKISIGDFKLKKGQPEKLLKNLKRSLAPINPINAENSNLFPLHLLSNSSNLSHAEKHISNVNDPTKYSLIKKNSLNICESNVLKTKDAMVNRIISTSNNPDNINVDDLRSIINLYSALVRRPKDGITKVLMGLTDTGKSTIYNHVIEHVRSKGSDLETYRKIYEKLSKEFKNEIVQVINQAAEHMMEEKNYNHIFLKNKLDIDPISIITEGSHPLYPLEVEEVKCIVELYSTLSERPKDGITKVLNYSTNTSKSSIYNDIITHVKFKGSDIEIYRNIYARITKALKGEAMRIIYQMVNDKIVGKDIKEEQSPLKNEDRADNPKEMRSIKLISQNHLMNIKEQNKNDPSVNSYADTLYDEDFQTKDGKYSISKKDQQMLNRIYNMLPEYHGKSISGVLSGATLDKRIPIWKDLEDAIEQIKKEAEKEGETRKIDLNYFRKLYWLSVRITGKGGFKEKDTSTFNKDKLSLKKDEPHVNSKKIKISKKKL